MQILTKKNMKKNSSSSLLLRQHMALGSYLSSSYFKKFEIYSSGKDHSQILFYFFPCVSGLESKSKITSVFYGFAVLYKVCIHC